MGINTDTYNALQNPPTQYGVSSRQSLPQFVYYLDSAGYREFKREQTPECETILYRRLYNNHAPLDVALISIRASELWVWIHKPALEMFLTAGMISHIVETPTEPPFYGNPEQLAFE